MINSGSLGRVRLMPIFVVVVGLVMTMETDLTRPGNEWLAGFGKLALCEVIDRRDDVAQICSLLPRKSCVTSFCVAPY